MTRLGIATALLSLLVATTAFSQTRGTIEGAVVDANGNPLPGVVVTVTGPGERQEHIAGANGAYAAAGLVAGDYVVTAILPGFETVVTPARIAAREARDQSSPASMGVTQVAGSLRWGSTEESAGALGRPGPFCKGMRN